MGHCHRESRIPIVTEYLLVHVAKEGPYKHRFLWRVNQFYPWRCTYPLYRRCLQIILVTPPPQSQLMMMITFITLNSSLVPLITGLCSSNPYRFEFSVFRPHLLLFFCRKGKYVTEQIQAAQGLIPPPCIYIHMCTLYTCTNTDMPRFSPSGSLLSTGFNSNF